MPQPSPPTTIRLPAPPLCLAAHPAQPLLAAGLTDGSVVVTPVQARATGPALQPTHKLSSSVAALTFLQRPATGAAAASARLLAAASDASTVTLFHADRADAVCAYALPPHDGAPRAGTAFLPLSPNSCVVGDDAGGLHLLDARAPRLQADVLQQADYISALAAYPRAPRSGNDAPLILSASGDGTLCAYDLRLVAPGTPAAGNNGHRKLKNGDRGGNRGAPKSALSLFHVSEAFNDDLLSLAVLDVAPQTASSAAPRVVAGCLSGALNVYDLAALHDGDADRVDDMRVERFHGHPECVNAVLATPAHDVVATASTDGLVRVVDVNNHALLGVLDYDRRAPASLPGTHECSDADGADDAHGVAEGATTKTIHGEQQTGTRRSRGKKRKKMVVDWPIESMVQVNGADKLTYALVSHDECVRLCDASVLCEDDDGSDDGAEGKTVDKEDSTVVAQGAEEGEDGAERSSGATQTTPTTTPSRRSGLLEAPEPLETKSQKKKKKKKLKRRGEAAQPSVTAEKRASGFFDQL